MYMFKWPVQAASGHKITCHCRAITGETVHSLPVTFPSQLLRIMAGTSE